MNISNANVLYGISGGEVSVGALRGAVEWLLKRCAEKFFQLNYGVWQVERCPSTRRLHVHLYIVTKNQVRVDVVRKAFPADVRVRKGTDQECWDYCSKEASRASETFYPFGNHRSRGAGKRTDLVAARDLIKSGAGIAAVFNTDADYQCVRYAMLAATIMEPSRSWAPEVWWHHGATGTGKTRLAFDELSRRFPGFQPWMSMSSLDWFQGYDCHPGVIFDDFRKGSCKFDFLLRLLDRYPLQVPTKGGSRQFLAKVIYITSPWSPTTMYGSEDDKVAQLLRRLICSCPNGHDFDLPSYDFGGDIGSKTLHVRLFGDREIAAPVFPAMAPHFVPPRR